ncbi:MAG: hypothetical protein J1F28_04550 [Oscillospiraceae bacterium]|nr:hypothetical protein [Oscillospiraceae bacterium]
MSNEKNARESEIKEEIKAKNSDADVDSTGDLDEEVDNIVKSITNPDPQFTCKLKKPVTYNGIEYTELTFDYEKLTADDALNIEDELLAIGRFSTVDPAFYAPYLIRMAARACTEPIGVDLLRKLSFGDFHKIRNRTKYFLLNSVR